VPAATSAEPRPSPAGSSPAVEDPGDGGALAWWVAGEVVVLVGGCAAWRYWSGRRRRPALRAVPPLSDRSTGDEGLMTGRVIVPGGRDADERLVVERAVVPGGPDADERRAPDGHATGERSGAPRRVRL
jgi:hypothetical protein